MDEPPGFDVDQAMANSRLLLRLIDEAPFAGEHWNALTQAFHEEYSNRGLATFEVRNARMGVADLLRLYTERVADGSEAASRHIGLEEFRDQLRGLAEEELRIGIAMTATISWAVYLSNDISRVVAYHGVIHPTAD